MTEPTSDPGDQPADEPTPEPTAPDPAPADLPEAATKPALQTPERVRRDGYSLDGYSIDAVRADQLWSQDIDLKLEAAQTEVGRAVGDEPRYEAAVAEVHRLEKLREQGRPR